MLVWRLKNANSFYLAPMAVEILFFFSLKKKRLQRTAGIWFKQMPKRLAPNKK